MSVNNYHEEEVLMGEEAMKAAKFKKEAFKLLDEGEEADASAGGPVGSARQA